MQASPVSTVYLIVWLCRISRLCPVQEIPASPVNSLPDLRAMPDLRAIPGSGSVG
ncbi:hypothetical protein [Methanoregula sp.]|uniref:hypothetical protein n=1 Tax=Methanoregula sp. TaxID=2052170 RepID=UPI0035699DD8